MEQCEIGKLMKDNCHSDRFSNKRNIYHIKNFSQSDIILLKLRLPSIANIDEKTICEYHNDRYLNYYSTLEVKCCDPLSCHKKTIKNNLSIISVENSQKWGKFINAPVIPGKKICTNCISRLNDLEKEISENICRDPLQRHRTVKKSNLVDIEQNLKIYITDKYSINLKHEDKICEACYSMFLVEFNENKIIEESSGEQDIILESDNTPENSLESTPISSQFSNVSLYTSDSQKKKLLDTILQCFELNLDKEKLTGERLREKVVDKMQEILIKTSDAFESVLDIELSDFKKLKQMNYNSLSLQQIIGNIQSKFEESNYDQKVQLLTLLPLELWKYKAVNEHFQCSYYMYSEALKLKKNQENRVRKNYSRIPDEIKEEIKQFYLNDDNSIMCSGMKEYKKIKVPGQDSITKQKRILIYELKDLYNKWKNETNHNEYPCFAFFANLRPVECVIAGDAGTHNVCVCLSHQNVKLKVSAPKKALNYHEVMESSVCSVNSKNCMLHLCSKCPQEAGVAFFLNLHLTDKSEIAYSNWNSISIKNKDSEKCSNSSRVTLLKFTEPYESFVESLSEDVWNLTEHHFIAENQKKYFLQCKGNLEHDTGLIIMDFAENYTYICQNSTQGFYFHNTSATLFTVALYCRNAINNSNIIQSFCVISECGKHQAYSVHIYLEQILNYVKDKFPWIKNIIYFSDGAITQFKNKNHMANLAHHEQDFGIKVKSHNFFATSHGKSSCDGIGAVLKRKARKASLQGIPILNAREMYSYFESTDSEIKCFYVEEKLVEERGKKLDKRFKNAKAINEIRKLHYFEPIDEKIFVVKLFSLDSASKIANVL